MKLTKNPKRRSDTAVAATPVYTDEDTARFEARLRRNVGKKEPRVPPMTARKGKRTRFTGLSIEGTVAALKKSRPKKKAP